MVFFRKTNTQELQLFKYAKIHSYMDIYNQYISCRIWNNKKSFEVYSKMLFYYVLIIDLSNKYALIYFQS